MDIKARIEELNQLAKKYNKERESKIAHKEVAEANYKDSLEKYEKEYGLKINNVTELKAEYKKVTEELEEEVKRVEGIIEKIEKGDYYEESDLIDLEELSEELDSDIEDVVADTKLSTQESELGLSDDTALNVEELSNITDTEELNTEKVETTSKTTDLLKNFKQQSKDLDDKKDEEEIDVETAAMNFFGDFSL